MEFVAVPSAQAQTLARMAEKPLRSLSTHEVAVHSGVDESRVRHMAIDGDLYRLPTKVRRSHAFPDSAHSSSMTGGLCVTLFNPADDAFPDQPAFSATLAHPDLLPRLEVAATRIGYGIF